MEWRPVNDIVLIRAVLNKEKKESDIKQKYELKDYHFIVEAINEADPPKGIKVGDEVLMLYFALNNITEDLDEFSKEDRFYFINKMDIRLVK